MLLPFAIAVLIWSLFTTARPTIRPSGVGSGSTVAQCGPVTYELPSNRTPRAFDQRTVEWWREGYAPYRFNLEGESQPYVTASVPLGGPYLIAVGNDDEFTRLVDVVDPDPGLPNRCHIVQMPGGTLTIAIVNSTSAGVSRSMQLAVGGGIPPFTTTLLGSNNKRRVMRHIDTTFWIHDLPEASNLYVGIEDASGRANTLRIPNESNLRLLTQSHDLLRLKGRADSTPTSTPTTSPTSTSTTSASASATSTVKFTARQQFVFWFLIFLPWDVLLMAGVAVLLAYILAFALYGMACLVKLCYQKLRSCCQCRRTGKSSRPSSVIGYNPSSSMVNLPGQIPVIPFPPPVVGLVPGIQVIPPPATIYNIPDGVASMSMADVGVGVAAPPPVGLAIVIPPRPVTFASSTTSLGIASAMTPPAFATIMEDADGSSNAKQDDQNPKDKTGLSPDDPEAQIWIRHSSLEEVRESGASPATVPLAPAARGSQLTLPLPNDPTSLNDSAQVQTPVAAPVTDITQHDGTLDGPSSTAQAAPSGQVD
ncbi:hypothetical protein FRB99_001682 [Tulasnella sp. 403]|nr:hypothetical protein FRB99_001682 [Tulasnella sp. 403]